MTPGALHLVLDNLTRALDTYLDVAAGRPAVVSADELHVLLALTCADAGRGDPADDPEAVSALLEKGLLRVSSSGDIEATDEGRELAVRTHDSLTRVIQHLGAPPANFAALASVAAAITGASMRAGATGFRLFAVPDARPA